MIHERTVHPNMTHSNHGWSFKINVKLNLYLQYLQISLEFRNLAQEYRDVISDICHHMGVGMAEFLEKKVGSMKDWDQVSVRLELPLLCKALPVNQSPPLFNLFNHKSVFCSA